MGVFLDPKLKKMKMFLWLRSLFADCQSQNLIWKGLAFLPIAKNAAYLILIFYNLSYEVNYERHTHRHEGWCNSHPAIVEISINFVSNHCFNAFIHSFAAKTPTDGSCLKEHTPQQRHPTGCIEVHQLEYVHSPLKFSGWKSEH